MSTPAWQRWQRAESLLLERQAAISTPDTIEQELLEELNACWQEMAPREQEELERQAHNRLMLLSLVRQVAPQEALKEAGQGAGQEAALVAAQAAPRAVSSMASTLPPPPTRPSRR